MVKAMKAVTIIVNGTAHEWAKGEITYAEVVTLDVPDYARHPEKKGHGHRPEGVLPPGGSVRVKDGMVFSVSATGQS